MAGNLHPLTLERRVLKIKKVPLARLTGLNPRTFWEIETRPGHTVYPDTANAIIAVVNSLREAKGWEPYPVKEDVTDPTGAHAKLGLVLRDFKSPVTLLRQQIAAGTVPPAKESNAHGPPKSRSKTTTRRTRAARSAN